MKHYIMKINHDEVVIPKYEYYFYMLLDDFLRLNPGEKIIKIQTDMEGNEIDFRLFNKLFYIAKIPIMANRIKDNKILGGYRLEFERYGVDFNKSVHDGKIYLKNEDDIDFRSNRFYNKMFKINKQQTERVRVEIENHKK